MNAAIKQGRSSLDVARYMIDRCAATGANSSITPMHALKLVYIAHGWMLGLAGQPLIKDEVQAWRYGPVIPVLYDAIKSFKSGVVTNVPGASSIEFDANERDIMDQVCAIYGPRNGIELSRLTHKDGSPWAEAWSQRVWNAPISNDVIAAHYAKLASERRAA